MPCLLGSRQALKAIGLNDRRRQLGNIYRPVCARKWRRVAAVVAAAIAGAVGVDLGTGVETAGVTGAETGGVGVVTGAVEATGRTGAEEEGETAGAAVGVTLAATDGEAAASAAGAMIVEGTEAAVEDPTGGAEVGEGAGEVDVGADTISVRMPRSKSSSRLRGIRPGSISTNTRRSPLVSDARRIAVRELVDDGASA